MKKHLRHIACIIAAILLVAALCGCDEQVPPQTQPTSAKVELDADGNFTVYMFGAELSQEGTVISEFEFTLSGQILGNAGPGTSRIIRLNPFALGGLFVNLDDSSLLSCNLTDAGYSATWTPYRSDLEQYTILQMELNGDLRSCAFSLSGTQERWFIASADPDYDIDQLLIRYCDTLTPVPADINWPMYGLWVTRDGQPQEEMQFSIIGSVQQNQDASDKLSLNIIFPDECAYSYDSSVDFVSSSRQHLDVEYYVCPGYCFNERTAELVWSFLALSEETGFAIFYMEDNPDSYLVASLDPDTDPQVILEYFQAFFEVYLKK